MAWFILLLVIALVVIQVPVGYALGITGVIVLLIKHMPLTTVAIQIFDGGSNFPMLAITMFMLTGELMNKTNISNKLIDFATSLVGFIRGGLAMVSIVTSMFFAEISGSSVADAAALGSILIPQMKEKGYPDYFAASVISSAATTAIIIPPSIPMIIYAVIAGVSVTKMFIAGVLPGLVVGFALMVVAYYLTKKQNYPIEQTFAWSNVWTTFKAAFTSLSLPIVILGGILGGVFTATEAAGVAVILAIIIGWKKLKLKDFPQLILNAGRSTAQVMLIVAASALLGYFMASEQMPQAVAKAMLSVSTNKWIILLMLNVIFLIVGCFLHSTAAIIMLVPILMPLVKQVGIDPIHFGMVLTLNLGIGQQTPPVASVLLTTCSIAGISIQRIFKSMWWFLGSMIVMLGIVTYWPWLSLWLPSFLGK